MIGVIVSSLLSEVSNTSSRHSAADSIPGRFTGSTAITGDIPMLTTLIWLKLLLPPTIPLRPLARKRVQKIGAIHPGSFVARAYFFWIFIPGVPIELSC